MDTTEKIDLIIQLALTYAAEAEDWNARELGPIHLIKYVYIADLEYAKHHEGETFTRVRWQFYHFGPWAVRVFQRIEPALLAINAQKKTISGSQFKDDFDRWSVRLDDSEVRGIHSKVPSEIKWAVRNKVYEFGADTTELLRDVYTSKPMLRAKPNDYLDFTNLDLFPALATKESTQTQKLTARQQKKLDQKKKELQAKFKEKFEQKKAQRQRSKPMIQPRYDEVFEQGTAWLDSLAGQEIGEFSGVVTIDDSIWTMKGRDETDA